MTDFNYEDFKGLEQRNFAKLEFLALKPELELLIDKNLSCKAIYLYFSKKGRLTMKYPTFSGYMLQLRRQQAKKSKDQEADSHHFQGVTSEHSVSAEKTSGSQSLPVMSKLKLGHSEPAGAINKQPTPHGILPSTEE